MIWNPKPHVQHAWSDTGTVYAKAALVLFYGWLWINVLWAVFVILFPTTGLECIFDSADKATHTFLVGKLNKQSSMENEQAMVTTRTHLRTSLSLSLSL